MRAFYRGPCTGQGTFDGLESEILDGVLRDNEFGLKAENKVRARKWLDDFRSKSGR